jgi:hypothetical protein
MIMKMLAHIHMVVYTWWCWHIYKGEVFGVKVDQLGEEMEVKQVTRSDRTLASEGPTCPVICSREGVDVDLRPDAGVEGDLTRRVLAVLNSHL